MNNDSDNPQQFSSPACFAHELVDGPLGISVHDPQTALDVSRWRKAKRKELIEGRLAVSASDRNGYATIVAKTLGSVIRFKEDFIVSAYWPLNGELDLRPWMAEMVKQGARVALPVVSQKNHPLIFREWKPGTTLQAGFWNIPVPVDTPELVPDVVVVPLVGYDKQCFRLGYGGGYFDRTLAVMPEITNVIGVGFSNAEVPTIFPQPHDIPMSTIVTTQGVVIEREY